MGARRVRRLRPGHQRPFDFHQGHAVPGVRRKRQADLSGQIGKPELSAGFNWLEESGEIWTIRFETGTGDIIKLEGGGRSLTVNDELVLKHGDEEYAGMYLHFAGLLERHESDVDATPLRLMSDVFLMGARENGPDFEW